MEFQFTTSINGVPFLGPMITLQLPYGDILPMAGHALTGSIWPARFNWDLIEAAQKAENERAQHFLTLTEYMEGAKFDAPYPCPDKVEPNWMGSAVEQWMKMHPPEEDFVDGGITVDDIAQEEVDTVHPLLATAIELGNLVVEKNRAYGDSFRRAGDFLKMLYPNGVQPNQYQDMLAIVRCFDKFMRIATDKDAFGETPWKDVAGYSILSATYNKGENGGRESL